MLKHYHISEAEQNYTKAQDLLPFHYENMPYQSRESMRSEYSRKKMDRMEGSIKSRAYQSYREKGTFAVPHWRKQSEIWR